MALAVLVDHTQPSLGMGTQHLADYPRDTPDQPGAVKGPSQKVLLTKKPANLPLWS